MTLHIDIRTDTAFLNVLATGKFSLKEAQRTFLEVLEAVGSHHLKKVIIDGREVIGKPETIERFYYGKFVANSIKAYKTRGVSGATAFAYVINEPLLDRQRFGETVAVNRGAHVRAFDNMEAAFKWLEIAPPHHASADRAA